jgi:adenylate kinase family enzyme
VIEHYRSKGNLVEVDGERDIQEIFNDILSKLGSA